MKCPHCGAMSSSTKFCTACGTPLSAAPTPAKETDSKLEFVADNVQEEAPPGYIYWQAHQGQVARVIPPKELEQYGNGLKGFIVAPNQRALIFAGGKLLTQLEGATYDFPSKPENTEVGDRVGGVAGFFRGVGRAVTNFFMGKPRGPDKNQVNERIAQAREQARTSELDRFIEHLKSGKPFSIVIARTGPFTIADELKEIPTATVRSDVGVEFSCEVGDFDKLMSIYLADREILKFSDVGAGMRSALETVAAEVLQNIDPEKIDTDSSVRNQFFKAMTGRVSGAIEILSINKLSLNNEELEQIRRTREELMLAEQRLEQLASTNQFRNRLQLEENRGLVNEARNQEDLDKQLHEINKDGLLREEDMRNFQRAIQERGEDHDISRAHSLDLVLQENLLESERTGLELRQLRREESVRDFDHDLDLERKRREFDRTQEEEDDLADLRTMEKLQEIGQRGKDADHLRKLQELEQYKGMTPEQILLVRPDLDPELVRAFVDGSKDTKFAEQQTEQSRENLNMMKDFMEKQLEVTRDMAMGNNAAREKELDRMQKSSQQTEERLSNVVQSTVDSFKGKAAEETVRSSQSGANKGEALFNVAVGKEDRGRHSISAIAQMIADGQFDSQSKVWRKGMDGWKTAVEVPEIADLLDDAPPPIPSDEDAPPPL